MPATDEAIVVLKEQIAQIDYAIETKTDEIKELKKVRRKLANSLEALESL